MVVMSETTPKTSKTALVTGASSGIGAAYARALAAQGYDLILVARRADRLQALADELKKAHGNRIEVLPTDLLKRESPTELVRDVASLGMQVDLLVNNAGLGVHGPFVDATADDDARMIDLNIHSLTAMTRAFVPGMIARHSGAIINVASTAAFQSIPFMSVYAATKAYVLSFSEATAEELRPHGITVQCLCPGATESEFAAVAQFKTDAPEKAPTMTAEAVVAESLAALKAGRTVHVAGVLNQLGALSTRLVPRVIATKLAGQLFKPNR